MSTGEWRQRVGDEATLSDWLEELLDGGRHHERPVAPGQGRFHGPSDREAEPAFSPEDLAADLRCRRLEDDDRVCPYVIANLALAADGRRLAMLAADLSQLTVGGSRTRARRGGPSPPGRRRPARRRIARMAWCDGVDTSRPLRGPGSTPQGGAGAGGHCSRRAGRGAEAAELGSVLPVSVGLAQHHQSG